MEYQDSFFRVCYHKNFVVKQKEKLWSEIFPEIEKKFRRRKDGNLYQKRYSVNYGLDYKINFKNGPLVRKGLPFGKEIQKLKKRVEDFVGHEFNTCFVQYYLSGSIGIKRHFDTEVEKGTVIASISFGETRTFCFEKGDKKFSFPLEDGSLFLIMPPTNDYWMHSLPEEKDLGAMGKGARMSIIFRKIQGM